MILPITSFCRIVRVLSALLGVSLATIDAAQTEAVVWRVDSTSGVGGRKPLVLGAPRAGVEDGRKALRFDGADDGLILSRNPLEGWRAFTIEVLFKPDGDGPAAQRFVHLEDTAENRALIETRITPEKQWYLDTFLFSCPTEKGVTLVDKTKLHPCDRWYWAALVYDGATMTHYVDGVKEQDGAIAFGPMKEGRTSLGVRLNRVFWFKGAIAEVRFHSQAVPPAELQRSR
ncbi:MAG: LamG domain-containing protein [Opitutaceae bacterium]